MPHTPSLIFFFFNDTATTEIYTLSLHDALPIWPGFEETAQHHEAEGAKGLDFIRPQCIHPDRKSTRLNSSHLVISYAVFCLKKKKRQHKVYRPRTRYTPRTRDKPSTYTYHGPLT